MGKEEERRVIDPHKEIGAIVKATLNLPEDQPLEIIPIVRGGSTRFFYRVRFSQSVASIIFVHYRHDNRENAYYASQTAFMQSIGVQVPQIHHHDSHRGFILMEDLGELDLWHYRQEVWGKRRKYYRKTLDMILKLHAIGPEDPRVAGVPLMDAFNLELYRWERDYFLENFVRKLCGVALEGAAAEALEKELARLAARLWEPVTGLIHRDLQSQNIMIRNDEPVLIDYQGMRYGNPWYDLGSLLYDPYVTLAEAERQDLLQYYYDGLATVPHPQESFRERFHLAAAQRLMQALGAYGFLGLRGERPHFLTHVPAGLANLIEVTQLTPQLPRLGCLARRCQEALAAQNFKMRG